MSKRQWVAMFLFLLSLILSTDASVSAYSGDLIMEQKGSEQLIVEDTKNQERELWIIRIKYLPGQKNNFEESLRSGDLKVKTNSLENNFSLQELVSRTHSTAIILKISDDEKTNCCYFRIGVLNATEVKSMAAMEAVEVVLPFAERSEWELKLSDYESFSNVLPANILIKTPHSSVDTDTGYLVVTALNKLHPLGWLNGEELLALSQSPFVQFVRPSSPVRAHKE
jgi:hypothetical protein